MEPHRLDWLLDASPTIVYSLRRIEHGFSTVWVSQNVERITGYSQAEALAPGWWYSNLHAEDRARAAARSAEEAPGELAHEYRFLRKDGSTMWIDDRLRLPGEGHDLVGAWTDITQRKNLELQLHEAQRLEALGRLAGGIAHDFNNMLGVVIGYGEIGLEDPANPATVTESLQEILIAARRCAHLTNQLLGFARKQQVRPVLLDLNQVIPEELPMLATLMGAGLELVWRPGPEQALAKLDPMQLRQVLVSLVENATDAIGRGPGRITISTRHFEVRDGEAERPGRYIGLAVRDDGAGIEAEPSTAYFSPSIQPGLADRVWVCRWCTEWPSRTRGLSASRARSARAPK